MVGAVSVGVVVCSVVVVVASGVEVVCVEGAVCSALVACVSPEACAEAEEAASGACAGALRAFAGLAFCVAVVCLAPAPFAAVLARVLPGKACAATSENTAVSITEPASSQRLQRVNRRRAASRE